MVDYVITVIIHLDYLYSDFLIQRTLLKRTQTTSSKILTLGSQILSTVLCITAERDRLGSFQTDLAWEVRLYIAATSTSLTVYVSRSRTMASLQQASLPLSFFENTTKERVDVITRISLPDPRPFRTSVSSYPAWNGVPGLGLATM